MSQSKALFGSILITILYISNAQIPIPKRPLGFPYGLEGQSLVQLDAFLDLACPDSKTAWPTLQKVADHYGVSNLRLNIILFPLPYHRTAFLTAQSTFIVDGLNSNATIKWMSDFFAVQEKFFTNAVVNESDSAIMSMIADVAGNRVDKATFLTKLQNDEGDSDARVMWKYSCSRTISGTPQFLVNGVGVAATPSWSMEDWKKVIDPLLGKKIDAKPITGTSCPSGTKSCEYLPGKSECCTAGENCIPNVGCRC